MPRKEFELLLMLLRNPGRVFSRDEILQRIWPEDVIVLGRVVDVNITRLRSKLGEYGKNIVTRPGYGYGFKV
jgi:DNA-binding response OmpR family regulator